MVHQKSKEGTQNLTSEIFKIINNRRSIRVFTNQPVTQSTLEKILKASRTFLLNFISLIWAGQPLISTDIAPSYVCLIQTTQGLKVHTILTDKEYPTGIRISNEQIGAFVGRNILLIHELNQPRWR